MTADRWNGAGDCWNRAGYIAGIAASFGTPLSSAVSGLSQDMKKYMTMLEKHRDDFLKPTSWAELASLSEAVDGEVVKHHSELAKSWPAVAKEVARLRVLEAG